MVVAAIREVRPPALTNTRVFFVIDVERPVSTIARRNALVAAVTGIGGGARTISVGIVGVVKENTLLYGAGIGTSGVYRGPRNIQEKSEGKQGFCVHNGT